MPKKIILAIDDEVHILDLLSYHLERAGYTLLRAQSGEDGLALLQQNQVDLLLLDWLLPGMDGMEVLKTIRAHPTLAQLPVLMLTAKNSEIDIVLSLEMGADDHLCKPFGTHELQARIKALLRRSAMVQKAATPSDALLVGEMMIHKDFREVRVRGEAVSLSLKEFDLLYILASQRGRVFTREQLIELVWGYEYTGELRTIDVHLRNLRKKIEKDPNHPEFLQTVRGMGYKCN